MKKQFKQLPAFQFYHSLLIAAIQIFLIQCIKQIKINILWLLQLDQDQIKQEIFVISQMGMHIQF
jgi:molybdenum cofactor biosynthesis enzyme MoaA